MAWFSSKKSLKTDASIMLLRVQQGINFLANKGLKPTKLRINPKMWNFALDSGAVAANQTGTNQWFGMNVEITSLVEGIELIV